MDDYMKVSHHKKNYLEQNKRDKKVNYLKNLISRILISIIFVLSVCILTKISDKSLSFINKYLFEEIMPFTKFNNWYQSNLGNLLPNNNENVMSVFSSRELLTNPYEKYEDGTKIMLTKQSPVSLLMGGIVVFIGEKDLYGNTLIIQGNDGIDYWYGNITNVGVN